MSDEGGRLMAAARQYVPVALNDLRSVAPDGVEPPKVFIAALLGDLRHLGEAWNDRDVKRLEAAAVHFGALTLAFLADLDLRLSGVRPDD